MRSAIGSKSEEDFLREVSMPSSAQPLRGDRQPSNKLLFEKNHVLKGIVKSQKIKKIKQNFINKISRTSTARPPIDI